MPTVAEDQAYARVAEHVRAAAGALGLALTELTAAYRQTMAAGDPTDGGPAGRVFVAGKWWLPSTAGRTDMAVLAGFWQANGYRTIADGRGEPLPYLWVEDPRDGFRVGLDTNTQGRLVLGASSPLFWPDGDGR